MPKVLKKWNKLDIAYEVKDKEIVVLVLTVGKRENNKVYDNLKDII